MLYCFLNINIYINKYSYFNNKNHLSFSFFKINKADNLETSLFLNSYSRATNSNYYFNSLIFYIIFNIIKIIF